MEDKMIWSSNDIREGGKVGGPGFPPGLHEGFHIEDITTIKGVNDNDALIIHFAMPRGAQNKYYIWGPSDKFNRTVADADKARRTVNTRITKVL